MGGWKKFIMGEKMPDKEDPQYKEQYERDVDAGRKFARWSKLDKFAANVQDFANKHTKTFLIIVFGFIIFSFGMNIYRMGRVWNQTGKPRSAVEQQDEMIKNRHRRVRKVISSAHCMPPSINREFQESVTQNNKDNGYTDAKEDYLEAAEIHAASHYLCSSALCRIFRYRPVPN